MPKPLLRIPYTDALPAPTVIPAGADTLSGAVAALARFFSTPLPRGQPASTVVLSGAGLSVASGLADYRGTHGTYRVNRTYRPIYYHEFLASHAARRRYWARSFLGWSALQTARPNAGHAAVGELGHMGLVSAVVTQNVDSFHRQAHPAVPTLELHGYLRATVCTSCGGEYPRDALQDRLARLNPAWTAFLKEAVASGALGKDGPTGSNDNDERRRRGIRTNPDGDVEVPGAPYTTFRYPACPTCLARPPVLADGRRAAVEVDGEGAWLAGSSAGILKPAVVMFGESISEEVKGAAEAAIDGAGRLLVLATSLATYSAWRLAKRAKDQGKPIAIVTMGGVRGEEALMGGLDARQTGAQGVRVDLSAQDVLPALVDVLGEVNAQRAPSTGGAPATLKYDRSNVFKDMLS